MLTKVRKFCSANGGVRFEEQFAWFDQDGSGYISESNFKEGMAKLGFAMSEKIFVV